MSNSSNTTNIEQNTSGIDKFDGQFEQEESGCTIVVNETINSIKNLAAGGLYLYLICRPKSWKLNVKYLASYFGCNKDKIYQLIDYLIEMRLLTRQEIRDKGKFVNYLYRLHLKPKTLVNTDSLPCLEKPDTVKPDTVFPDTYKTKKVLNKEDIDIYISTPENCTEELKNEEIAQEFLTHNTFKIPEHFIRTWIENRKQLNKPTNAGIWAMMNQDLYKYLENGLNPIESFERMVKAGWLMLDVKKELNNQSTKKKNTNSRGYSTAGQLGV